MDKYTIIDTFRDRLDDKSIIELDRILDQFQRDIELKTSRVIYKEISKVIDQVQDEATLLREKPKDEFLLNKESDMDANGN